MSEFIKIDENSFVKFDSIEAVEEIDGQVVVYTTNGRFTSNLGLGDIFNILDLRKRKINPMNQFVSL